MALMSTTYPALWRKGGSASIEVVELLSAIQRLTMDTVVDAEFADTWEDAEDVKESLAGDEDAFRRLIERHQAWVASRMWRFTRDETEHSELVQDVFVETWKSLKGFRERAPFRHWLARIATRVGYAFWKRRDRQKEHSKSERCLLPSNLPDYETIGECGVREAAETLFNLLDALPPRDRLVLTLRYVEELSVEQTADRCGWSATMVKVQTHRAKAKLRRLFDKARREGE